MNTAALAVIQSDRLTLSSLISTAIAVLILLLNWVKGFQTLACHADLAFGCHLSPLSNSVYGSGGEVRSHLLLAIACLTTELSL